MNMGHEGERSVVLPDESFGVIAAAHELKAPVALMRQLALELESEPNLTESQSRILQQLILSAERSLRLTASLTRTARLDDPMLFDSEPVNVQQLCEEVAHELAPLYQAHDRTIAVTSRRQSPLVVANRELLRSILLHFGDNALHYAGNDTVYFSVRQQGGEVLAGLRDYGTVSPRSLGSSLTGRPHSSGLGLKIARQFARAMHGDIGITHHRQGMTFYVRMTMSEQLSLL